MNNEQVIIPACKHIILIYKVYATTLYSWYMRNNTGTLYSLRSNTSLRSKTLVSVVVWGPAWYYLSVSVRI